ncbi:DapH/DapD/GlmU-related protein [Formosa sp. A9]|uniref:DapH/DapD/GlmU-related protein n=1 Tax=Formosa sp. A9 TaxID=3442641 RepID=UPI003EBBFD6D
MIQLVYLFEDIKRMVGREKLRWGIIWISRSFIGILFYRLERAFFLIFGNYYKYIRILFLPIIVLANAYSNIDINYKANIKGGLLILHPALGCVISGYSNIGKNLTLTGGNVIGVEKYSSNMEFFLGENCNMGANSTIIGPITLGDNVKVGASACVVKSYSLGNTVLAGVPAKPLLI